MASTNSLYPCSEWTLVLSDGNRYTVYPTFYSSVECLDFYKCIYEERLISVIPHYQSHCQYEIDLF